MTKITKRTVEAVEPAATPVFLWDDQLPGFGVKVLPNGQRRYLVKYRAGGGGRTAPQRWYTLGAHGGITAEQACDLAQQVLASVARGDDPQGDKFAFREAPTMAELWERYVTNHLPMKKRTSQMDDRQKWRDYVEPKIGRRKVNQVRRDEIDSIHKSLADRPYVANRVLALMSKLFNLAEKWEMRSDGSNPCRHVTKFKEYARDRYLTGDELVRLGAALREGHATHTETPYMIAAIQLLLLTGARLNEVLKARWDWVDLDRRVINLPDSKTGKKPLFLSEQAVDVLKGLQALSTSQDCPYIIRGRTSDQPLTNLAKPWKRLCERAEIEGVRLHDLRHTAASIGVANGMSLPIIGRILGHTQARTTQRYAHVDIDPALAAADQIGGTVSAALGLKKGS